MSAYCTHAKYLTCIVTLIHIIDISLSRYRDIEISCSFCVLLNLALEKKEIADNSVQSDPTPPPLPPNLLPFH